MTNSNEAVQSIQTDSLVEKAMLAIVEADLLDRYTDHDADDIAWNAARAVLEAVVPDIARRVWDEGFRDGRRQDGEGEDGPRYVNPYNEDQ